MIMDRSGRKVELFYDGNFARFVVFIRDHGQDGGIMVSCDELNEARKEARAFVKRLENEDGGSRGRYVVVSDQTARLDDEFFMPSDYPWVYCRLWKCVPFTGWHGDFFRFKSISEARLFANFQVSKAEGVPIECEIVQGDVILDKVSSELKR